MIYRGMVARCTRPTAKDWRYYGARGIRVCDRWLGPDGFRRFFADMGERPSKAHTLDRIDTLGPYSPDNCRWLSIKEQQRNRRSNRLVTIDGVTRCAAEWAELGGIPRQAFVKRLNSGWDPRVAFTTPQGVRRADAHQREVSEPARQSGSVPDVLAVSTDSGAAAVRQKRGGSE